MNILNLLASSEYLVLNKSLMKKVGINESILLTELASEHLYWESNKGLDDEDMFYSTVDNVEDNTTLNDYQQRKAIKKLEELNLIEVKVKGVPAKRFIRINLNKLEEIFDNPLRTSSLKIKELDTKNLKTNNNNINSNNTNNSLSKDKQLLVEKNLIKKAVSTKPKKPTQKDKLFYSLKNDILVKFQICLDDDINELLIRWLNGLYQVNKLPSESSLENSLNDLSKYNKEEIITAINKSIKGDYKTFYPEHIRNISADGIDRNATSTPEQLAKMNKDRQYLKEKYGI